jgi:hypothetical protein
MMDIVALRRCLYDAVDKDPNIEVLSDAIGEHTGRDLGQGRWRTVYCCFHSRSPQSQWADWDRNSAMVPG